MSIGRTIVRLREEVDMTQKELAKRLHINAAVMNRIELGSRPLRDEEIARLAEIFDVSTDYLLGRTSDRHRPYYELTAKDYKEIDNYIDNIETDLSAGLLLDGEPIDADAIATLKEHIRFAAEIAKREAKRKHTPKKYRD